MALRYCANKRWRKRHPKLRHEGKKRYYDQFKDLLNNGTAWKISELKLIVARTMTDRQLSNLLQRSVGAIQTMRHKFKVHLRKEKQDDLR